MSRYDDIIDLPHHRSKTHPHMPIADRAAQFAPFAALTGYGDAVEETARYTEEKLEPDADRLAELDERLCELLQHLDERPKVRVTYFVKDEKKTGGRYVTQSFVIRKVDTYAKILVKKKKNPPLQDFFGGEGK
mgnify:FL=1